MLKNASCQICTDVYDTESPVAAMPCGHTFHDNCLSRWLLNTRNCPSCRKPLKKSQQPIHRLFFSIDAATCSQLSGSSPTSKDPALLESNRKLNAQVSALQAAINKLKSECQQAEGENTALACTLADKNVEIQGMSKVQDKLKRRIREFTSKNDELDMMKNEVDMMRKELDHLRRVQVIVEGVEADVRQMLEEKAGYTPQQLTYVVLLRQQFDNAKRVSEKLKRDVAICREKLMSSQRKCSTAESEIEILKLELKQAEDRNVTLKRKCDALIKSMNSPRGISASLAKRMVHQSPAPEFVTPPPPAAPSNQSKGSERNQSILATSTPAMKPSSEKLDTSSDMFNESSAFALSDVLEDDVKQTLDFADEDQQPSKRLKLIDSKAMLTGGVGDKSPAHSAFAVTIKPKACIKVRAKSKMMPIQPISASSGHDVRDVTNLPLSHPSMIKSSMAAPRSQYFKQGFDGMGGQAHSFSRTQNAIQFNVFKKPAAVKSRSGTSRPSGQPGRPSGQPTINDYVVIE